MKKVMQENLVSYEYGGGHRMTDNIFEGLRGYIEYPCGCKAKILVYDDAQGSTSIQCPVCKKYAVFNYNSMTAVVAKAAKGAVHTMKLRK